MSIEEKRKIVDDFCDKQDACDGCMFENDFCDDCCTEDLSEEELDRVIAKIKNDPVNHPSHYCQGGIECLDAMTAAFGKTAIMNFCICNAFKYVFRHQHKNGIEDIQKAIFYLNKWVELNNANEVNEDGASETI